MYKAGIAVLRYFPTVIASELKRVLVTGNDEYAAGFGRYRYLEQVQQKSTISVSRNPCQCMSMTNQNLWKISF